MKSKKILYTTIALLTFLISWLFVKPAYERNRAMEQIKSAIETNALKNELKTQNCELYDDADGISHIKTESESAAYACWGFVQARDRAAQMDYLRRMSYGQKAEVGGINDLKSDFFIINLGIKEKAGMLFAEMNNNSKKKLLAFAYGVNSSFLELLQKKQVYEFEKLQIYPEPWNPENTLAILLLQSIEQTKDNFLRKLDEERWKSKFSDSAEQLFSKASIPWQTFILKSDDLWSKQNSTAAQSSPAKSKKSLSGINWNHYSHLRKTLFAEEHWGSNNWVIAPEKSVSKNAWLANDPHLSLKNPPFWYWMHIEAPGFNTIGANLPGAPIFPSGTNMQTSWGLTNSYLPVGNVYFVKKAELENSTDVTQFRPLLWFRFWKFKFPFFFKTVQRIKNKWPILPIDLHPDYTLVFHWSSLDLEGHNLDSFFDLVKTKSVDETDAILSKIRLNSWNFVFADISGNIGYRATGLVHRYRSAPAFGIEQKSLPEILDLLAAKNYLGIDEIPHLKNPKRQYIATANNRQWQSANYFLGSTSNSEFRAHRIESLLTQTSPPLDFDKIHETQCDVEAEDAKVLLPLLNNYFSKIRLTEKETSALNILKQWNFKTSLDCKECFLYRRWLDLVYEKLEINVIALYNILSQPKLLDQEKFNKELRLALLNGFNEFLELEKNSKRWGDMHVNRFNHLWGSQFLHTNVIGTPGDQETVSPGTADWDGKLFEHKAGASQRLIVELTNPPTVYSSLAGENQDHEIPELNDNKMAWQNWAQCQLSKRNFPLNWTQVNTKKITF